MPLIDLTVPAGALAPEAKESLLEELATTLLHWEGAPDTEFFRSITWVYVHEIDPAALSIGGRGPGDARFRVDITVPEGALSERRKGGLVEGITKAVLGAAELEESEGMRVWTLIHEVPEGNWGAAGNVIRFAALREAAAAERERAEETVAS